MLRTCCGFGDRLACPISQPKKRCERQLSRHRLTICRRPANTGPGPLVVISLTPKLDGAFRPLTRTVIKI
jgi:hypothetical protein